MKPPTTERRLTKNEKRRLKEKSAIKPNESRSSSAPLDDDNIQIEYVSAADVLSSDAENNLLDAASLEQFKSIFQKFSKPEELLARSSGSSGDNDASEEQKDETSATTNAGGEDGLDDAEKKLSKRKKKLQSRLTVAELKQLVLRPEVVEAHDVTSSDPRLLVYLKSLRNTVPVPRHWSHKSKYLQRKRGIEKPPFKLPEFIADTGISKIRDAILEAEEKQKSKSRARSRVQPKMGKIDIDYQVLHDAFFKYQTKPKMTLHGDLYYEGREFETGVKDYKPGFLSQRLLEALGMTNSAHPTPWLTNMQRYGPPPSYPTLRIPGLNAPIPKEAHFGYHPGGWGKPPVDEYGRPIYGDVFGAYSGIDEGEEIIDKVTRWGDVIAVADEDEYDDDDDDDDEVEEQAEEEEEIEKVEALPDKSAKLPEPSLDDDFDRDVVDLRKRETADVELPQLYRVIGERATETGINGGVLFGSAKTYAVAGEASVSASVAGTASTMSKQGEEGDKSKRKRANEGEQAAKKFKDSFKF